MLLGLLIGSIPGIIIGSLLVHRISETFVRVGLAEILVFAGARLVVA